MQKDPTSSSSRSCDVGICQQVAQLHISGINQGFLPQLGLSFMTMLYEAIDDCPSSVLLVECSGSKVTGFISGTSSMKPIYLQLARRPLKLVASLLPSLVRPRRVKRIFEILRYGRQSGSKVKFALPTFELLSIVVSPAARGSGCAERLYRRLIQYCMDREIYEFKIVAGETLLPAHQFYKRMGAESVMQIQVHTGETSVVYIQKVSSKQEQVND